MTPEQYCVARTRGSGSSFFYAFLFMPEEQRRALMALYAFCREVDDIADEVSEEEVAVQKLGFWRGEIGRVFAEDGVPTHPVGIELRRACARYALDEELFDEILDGMLMDITRHRYQKPADLSLYCYRVAGVVGLLSIEIFGYTSRRARDFATTLGEALQLTNILRDVAEDARRGRIYLPRSDRIRFGAADEDFHQANFDSGLRPLLRHYGNLAEQRYAEALELLPEEDRATLRPSLLMGAIYRAYLTRIRQCDFDVWSHPVRLLPLRKIWIAWRAWRYEKRAARRPDPLPATFDF